MIKAAIFDYGGVIIRMPPGLRYSNFLRSFFNVPKRTIKREATPFFELLQKGMITEYEFWKRLSLALGKPVLKNTKGAWRQCLKDNFHIIPEMVRLVKEIKSKGVRTVILSNTIKSHIREIKESLGYKNFDVLIFSCIVGTRKPELKIFKITLEKLKVSSEECLFIDDERNNLKSAQKLGMKVILAENPKQVIRDIRKILIR